MPLNSDVPDDDLVRRAREGDLEALGMLLDKYQPLLLRLAYKLLGCEMQRRVNPSDVIQETSIEAVTSILKRKLPGTTEDEFRQWIFLIFKRVIIKSFRRHIGQQKRSVKREQHDGGNKGVSSLSLIDEVVKSLSTPSGHAIRRENVQVVQSALLQLPPDQQLAVRLCHIEGQSINEVARVLDRSYEAVVGLLRRGLEKLKSILKKHGA